MLIPDEELTDEIKKAVDSIPFHGTGHKKIYMRIHHMLNGRGQIYW